MGCRDGDRNRDVTDFEFADAMNYGDLTQTETLLSLGCNSLELLTRHRLVRFVR